MAYITITQNLYCPSYIRNFKFTNYDNPSTDIKVNTLYSTSYIIYLTWNAFADSFNYSPHFSPRSFLVCFSESFARARFKQVIGEIPLLKSVYGEALRDQTSRDFIIRQK